MYEILHADMYHENRCIHEQSTARWDALLAGLTVVSTRCFGTRPLPLSAAPPSANVGKASHLAPVMRALRTRAGNPRARSESTRASSQRMHRVRRAEYRSEGRRSRGAWNVREGERARPSSARSGHASRSRKRMTNRARIRLCSDSGGAWNVRAKAWHLASREHALRAPRAEAENALSAHESVKQASAPSHACRAPI